MQLTRSQKDAIDTIDQDLSAVYEPFGGSGTTLMACETLGRNCYCVEIEPRFVDVIVTRWQNFTGRAATLEGGQQSHTRRDRASGTDVSGSDFNISRAASSPPINVSGSRRTGRRKATPKVSINLSNNFLLCTKNNAVDSATANFGSGSADGIVVWIKGGAQFIPQKAGLRRTRAIPPQRNSFGTSQAARRAYRCV